jgi:hypothetical protein
MKFAGGVSVVLKGLLHGVLMVGEGSTKGLGVFRAHTFRFISFFMVEGGQGCGSVVADLFSSTVRWFMR